MIDCSFIAMIGPGSDTRTVNGGSLSAFSSKPEAVDAAQAWDWTCKRSVGSSGRSSISTSVTSSTSTCTSPWGVVTRTPDGPLGLAPVDTSSSSCECSFAARRSTVSRSVVARYGVDSLHMTARPPTRTIGRPVCSAMTGIALTSRVIELPASTTDGCSPDTVPRLRWCPHVQDLPATSRILREIECHEQRVGQRPRLVCRCLCVNAPSARERRRRDTDAGRPDRRTRGGSQQSSSAAQHALIGDVEVRRVVSTRRDRRTVASRRHRVGQRPAHRRLHIIETETQNRIFSPTNRLRNGRHIHGNRLPVLGEFPKQLWRGGRAIRGDQTGRTQRRKGFRHRTGRAPQHRRCLADSPSRHRIKQQQRRQFDADPPVQRLTNRTRLRRSREVHIDEQAGTYQSQMATPVQPTPSGLVEHFSSVRGNSVRDDQRHHVVADVVRPPTHSSLCAVGSHQ